MGADVFTGRSVPRSYTVHGDLAAAEQCHADLAAQAWEVRGRGAPPLRTVGDLLEVWIGAGHEWKPATWVNYRGTVRRLLADPLAHRLLATLHPPVARAVMLAWTTAGCR